jgi:hypothetical protein
MSIENQNGNFAKPMLSGVFQRWKNEGLYEKMPKDYQLIFTRKIWELSAEHNMGYSFTKDELDKAEKSEDGFIGKQNGLMCYLQRPLNFR